MLFRNPDSIAELSTWEANIFTVILLTVSKGETLLLCNAIILWYAKKMGGISVSILIAFTIFTHPCIGSSSDMRVVFSKFVTVYGDVFKEIASTFALRILQNGPMKL